MSNLPSTSAAGRVIDTNLEDAKVELRKSVQRLLTQSLRGRASRGDDRKQLFRVGPVVPPDSVEEGDCLSSDARVARYLRQRGYDYALSVLMAEANVPDSSVLKSIAINLRDNRSRLVLGNPDFQAAVLQIWDETERKYNEKLRQYVIDWEMKQTMQLKRVENLLRRRMAEEEQEAKRQISLRLAELEAKERDLADALRDRMTALEREADRGKSQLLAEARNLDGKRREMQSLETEFQRQVDIEQNRIKTVKENLNQLSSELKRQQLQLTFQMDEAVKEAKRQEQLRYTTKLQQIGQKEAKLREIIEKAKLSRGQVDALKFMLSERDSKIQELEVALQQCKAELIKDREKLRDKDENLRRMNDYELLKFENLRVMDETKSMKDQLTKEKLQMQQRNFDLEAKCRDLARRLEELTPNEENPFKKDLFRQKADFDKTKAEWKIAETHYQEQLADERSKNDQLQQRLDGQTERLHSLVEGMKKMQFQLAKKQILSEVESYGNRVSTNFDDYGAVGEEATPDYLKEAKRRLRILEKETEVFEDSMRRYQQKSIELSSLSMRQAQTASSFYGYREPRSSEMDVHQPNDHAAIGSGAPSGPTVTQQAASSSNIRQSYPDGHFQSSNQSQANVPTQPTLDNDQDDWEARLRKREEERTRRDEEVRRKQEEEMQRMKGTTKQVPPDSTAMDSAPQKQQEPAAPAIDPMMQKYMQMVLDQRQKEKESLVGGGIGPAIAAAVERISEQKLEVDVESVSKAPKVVEVAKEGSDSDFEW